MPHIHEKIDFTVETFIVFQGKVLLRKHDKYGIWLGAGGHIEPDEDPVQAVIRECKEETGLDVRIVPGNTERLNDGTRELPPPAFINRHRINDTHEHVAFVYFAVSETDEIIDEGREQSGGMKWFTEQELLDSSYGIKENIKRYAQAALQTVNNI